MKKSIALFALLSILSFNAHADFSGHVIGVLDGDTVEVLVDKNPVRVRLEQIDAPERRQAFGTRSRQALSAYVFDRQITVLEGGKDRYGRVLGTLMLDGRDINRAMIADGMAWAYRSYLRDPSLLTVEAQARASRTGLWADADPVAPWEFRKRKRNGAGN